MSQTIQPYLQGTLCIIHLLQRCLLGTTGQPHMMPMLAAACHATTSPAASIVTPMPQRGCTWDLGGWWATVLAMPRPAPMVAPQCDGGLRRWASLPAPRATTSGDTRWTPTPVAQVPIWSPEGPLFMDGCLDNLSFAHYGFRHIAPKLGLHSSVEAVCHRQNSCMSGSHLCASISHG